MSLVPTKCGFCAQPANLMCQRCAESYCSVNCQMSHWPVHKMICIPMPPLVPIPSVRRLSVGSDSLDNKATMGKTPVAMPNVISSENSTRSVKSEMNSNYFQRKLQNPQNLQNASRNLLDAKRRSCALNLSIGLDGQAVSVEPKIFPCHNCFEISRDKQFSAVVQFIEKDPTLVWVIQATFEKDCNKLFEDINEFIQKESKRCQIEEIEVGQIYLAPFENFFYRVEALEDLNAIDEVRVRLIDYGNDIYVAYSDLRLAPSKFKNINAYGFRIRYKNAGLAIGHKIEIKVIGMDANKVYQIEEIAKETPIRKELPTENALKQSKKDKKITIVKILDTANKAIGVLKNPQVFTQLATLNLILPSPPNGDKLTEFKEGEFVAAKVEFEGWRRAIFLAQHKNTFIVSCIDYGEIRMAFELRPIPDDIAKIPIQTIVINFKKPASPDLSFADYNLQLQEEQLIGGIKAILSDENDSAIDVMVFIWKGTIDELEMPFWKSPLYNTQKVCITHFLSASKLYVVDKTKLQIYEEIFNDIGTTSETYTHPTMPTEIVLAQCGTRFVRCVVVQKPTPQSSDLLELDSGRTLTVVDNKLKLANKFVKCAPVTVHLVNLKYVKNITVENKSNRATKYIKECIEERKPFTQKFENHYKHGVELFEMDNSSFNKNLISKLFDEDDAINEAVISPKKSQNSVQTPKSSPVVTEIPPEVVPAPEKQVNGTQLDESVKNMSVHGLSAEANKTDDSPEVIIVEEKEELVMLDDIVVEPIKIGSNIDVVIMDSSTLAQGAITACNFDSVFLQKLETEYVDMIEKYCKDPATEKSYVPRANEVCLSIFVTDNRWYRVFCAQVLDNDRFLIVFLDYGNSIIVTSKDLRKMPREFLFPCKANVCYFADFPKAISTELAERIKKEIFPDSFLQVDKVEKVDEVFIFHVNKLKTISQK